MQSDDDPQLDIPGHTPLPKTVSVSFSDGYSNWTVPLDQVNYFLVYCHDCQRPIKIRLVREP